MLDRVLLLLLLLTGVSMTSLSLQAAEVEIDLDRSVPKYLIGRKFQAELDRTISASWSRASLRHILNRLADDRNISILIDRRLDPSRKMSVDTHNQSVLETIRTIAGKATGRTSVVAGTVFVGPQQCVEKIRTLIELRNHELFDLVDNVDGPRQFEMSKRATLHWNDLDRPVDLIVQIAARYQLTVEGLDRIPHDLWAGNTLPRVDVVEALSLILIQFELTFQWNADATAIRIIPVPDAVFTERRYSPRKKLLKQVLRQWQTALPGLQGRVEDGRIVVRGTIEQHEAVAELLRPRRRRNSSKPADKSTPLRNQEFTFKNQQVRFSSLMRKLAETGVTFQYDADALQDAGIDLDQRIEMNVEKASADEFFRAMCEPLGLKFTIDNVTVTLEPKS